ncbi:MAG: glycoside hydrolase family 2 TIM barrel-domain containing protein [Candidatus Paceibacteria bacterium]
MMKQPLLKKVSLWFLSIFGVACFIILALAYKPVPEQIAYGMSFNTPYARELGLDWQETYDAIIDDLGVRRLRLAAHWPMVEPQNDVWNFKELDYQVKKAEAVGATIVFAVGRRLPRWPECHVPDWVDVLDVETQQAEQLTYMTAVIDRYKDSPAIIYWQIENEPFLSLFAFEHCGPLDEEFLAKEIALARELDPTRPILVTDSGNLGTWAGAFRHGDAFGTSVYVHFWNPELGQFRTLLPPWFYRFKESLMELRYGKKPTLLIELSAEPWLVAPVTEVPLAVQYTRMNLDKFNDILEYAKRTRYDTQYLWGAEWWYWLYKQGEHAMWNRGKELFHEPDVESKDTDSL